MSGELVTVLTVEEEGQLAQCEEAILSGFQSFVETGEALAIIRGGKLYRNAHENFEAYCEGRWGMKKSHAYRLIDAAIVAGRISMLSDMTPIPETESQVRPLLKLPEEEQIDAWREAAGNGERITAAKVEEVVAERLSKDSPKETSPIGDEILDQESSPAIADGLGVSPPAGPMVEVFGDGLEGYKMLEGHLRHLRSEIKKLRSRPEGALIGKEIERDLNNAQTALKFARPFALASAKLKEESEAVRERGWISKEQYERLPEEMR